MQAHGHLKQRQPPPQALIVALGEGTAAYQQGQESHPLGQGLGLDLV